MKSIIIFSLLLISSSLSANDALIARFINAKTAMLQAQVNQLASAISLTQAGISNTEKYEQIGKPSFAATDRALSSKGFSIKTFYRFQSDHQIAIDQWLSQHTTEASQIVNLKNKRDNLSQTLEGAD